MQCVVFQRDMTEYYVSIIEYWNMSDALKEGIHGEACHEQHIISIMKCLRNKQNDQTQL